MAPRGGYKRGYYEMRGQQYGKYADQGYKRFKEYQGDAQKALMIAQGVRRLINVEYFNISTDFTSDPSTSGAVVNLTAIAQGDTDASRQGSKIRAKHIECSGVVTLNASATNSRVRMVIVRDNNGSTTIPAITDLYSTVLRFVDGRPKLGTAQSNSRFSILNDRMIIVDAGHGLTQKFFWSSSLDHHIYFSGTGATDEGKGHVYLFIASNEATNDPVVAANANLKFIDN